MIATSNTMTAKIFAALAGLGLVASSVVAFAPVAGAQTTTTTTTTTSASVTFSRDLTIGSSGADVTALQNWLISKGHTIAAGATGYFGAQTQAALAAYQAANGISPAAGYFGPITRAKVNAGGSSTGGTGTGTGSGSDNGDDLSGGEASLTDFDLSAEDSDGDEGEEGVELATAEFDVEDGDARVERVELTFDADSAVLEDRPWQYFDTIYVMVDGDEVADIDASDRDEWDETTDDVYVISISGLDYVVDEGDMASLTFAADIADSIDTADQAQEFEISVEDEGIRATDAEGIQQYVGDDADTVSFGFGAEDNGDLSVQASDEDPNSSILVADDEDESEEYLAFAFEIENDSDADSLVTSINVDVATSTAVVVNSIDDVIRTATLVIDGDEYDGDIGATSIDFDDIDVEVAGDETLNAELMITLVANAASTTMTFNVTGASDVEAEGVESGDDTAVDGDVTSEAHAVALTGIAVEPVSTSQSVTTPGDTAANTYGTYTIKFDVTALEEDAYIADLAASTSAAGNGAEFEIIGGTYAGPAASVSLTSTADLDTTGDDYYRVDQGETETFTLTVTLDPSAAGTFGVRLSEVNFNDTAADGDTTFTVDASEEDFRTDTIYIAN